ncbi:DUF7601 domain-containing protein [Catenisphaera adipataccumulans]|uniref:DUF7601 domain-containing protein n=1 Tax=Catenisphaera adipataccumulans TaxID=700500 RepID=A0A7W8FWD2_9FIRM|nr:hypothetical protein [Catenisphaera adipataccumulans]MBB5182575.1 hypothetical protein [Catenisphaera adipataccumulans]
MLVKRNSVLRWMVLFFCLVVCFFCFRVAAFAEETQSVDDPAVVLNQETDSTAQQDAQTKAVSETEQKAPAAKTSTSTAINDAETSKTAAANDATEQPVTEQAAAESQTVEKGDQVYSTEKSRGFVYIGYKSKDSVSQQNIRNDLLYSSYYRYGDFGVLAKSKNIIAYIVPAGDDPKLYNNLFIPNSGFALEVPDEILLWGQQHGKNWTKDTLIKNFILDYRIKIYFYDENGNPVDFIDRPQEHGMDSDDWNQVDKSSFHYEIYNEYIHVPSKNETDLDIAADHLIFTAVNNYYQDSAGSKTCRIGEMTQVNKFGSRFLESVFFPWFHFNPNYRGKLNIEFRQEALCKFEIDGQKYEILFHNPRDVAEFVVEDNTTKNDRTDASNADMNAEIKTTDQNGKTTVRSNSENETITGVIRGDQITYNINIDLSTEREMLLKLYQGIALHNNPDAKYSDKALEQAEKLHITLSQLIYWAFSNDEENKLFHPTITFTFTLPKDKDANGNYDLIVNEDTLKNVQLIQENPNGSPLWQIDPSETTYNANLRELKFTAYLSPDQIIQDFDESKDDLEEWYASVLKLLNSMIGSKLTAVISGVRVSDLAEVGKPFTVRAKVSGSLDYTKSYELLVGPTHPVGAKPNPGGGFEDADADWDDEGSFKSARRAVRMFRAMAAASADDAYTMNDLYSVLDSTDYDFHQLLFGHFAWTHLQDPSTKDVIQTEDNSEEFWYTVIIPSLDITKEVKGINTDQEFNFELKLDDASLAGPFNGTTYNAELHENGTVQNVAVNFKNGVATFKLKNGQTIRIIVPFDTHFTLRETDHNGYFVTIDKNGNRILSDMLRGVIESYTSLEDIEENKNAYTFTNEYEEPERPEESKEENVEETRSTGVQTGMMTQTGMWMVLALASIVILHKQRA